LMTMIFGFAMQASFQRITELLSCSVISIVKGCSEIVKKRWG
jgi:hypothetical protein